MLRSRVPWSRLARPRGLCTAPDYVIVGAGSAGCVLANRLTENPDVKVLLLEAGKPDRGRWDSWTIQMPAALTYNLADTRYNWGFETTPQKHVDGRVIAQPRGKGLGGSSSINAMAYIRGHPLDYDRWAEQGATGWEHDACLPYFKKAECFDGDADSAYQGTEGPLQVRHGATAETARLNLALIEAGKQAGYAESSDLNGYRQEGFGPMHMTVAPNGERSSTANAYLRPAMARPNLKVLTGCHATRVMFEASKGGAPRAVGVEYTQGGKQHTARAVREVLLCLGALGSPQLLMLSGVGPAEELAKHGIPMVLQSEAVGQNLQDHLDLYLQYECLQPHTLYPYATWRQPHKRIMAGLQWFTAGKGVAASNHFEAGGFIRTRAGIQHPDLQFHFIPGCVVGQLDFLPRHGFQLHCSTMRASSVGHVALSSADPEAAPVIEPNYLSTEQDVVDFRNGVRLAVEILEQQAMSPFRGTRIAPGPELDLEDDEALDSWVRQSTHSAYHPSCTCAMGAVTDPEGKVVGAEGLRVVDASLMPSVVSGNLNAPTIMIAEKLADSIKGLPGLPRERPAHWTHPEWQTKQR